MRRVPALALPLFQPVRALPAFQWRWLGRSALIGSLLALSVGLSLHVITRWITTGAEAVDWTLFTTAGSRIVAGENPYAFGTVEHSYRWSPLLAYVFALPIGLGIWTALAFASLALLRDWRLIGLTLLAYPFWIDTASGASFWYVPLVAILALRGSAGWTLVFVALTVLIPRPIMLPVLAWLVWNRPSLHARAFAVAVASLIGSFATGWGVEWIGRLTDVAGTAGGGWSLDPPGWVSLLLLPVAAWLTWKGRLGLASLAVSPYLLPSYWLMLLLEFPQARPDPLGDGSKRLPDRHG